MSNIEHGVLVTNYPIMPSQDYNSLTNGVYMSTGKVTTHLSTEGTPPNSRTLATLASSFT